MAGLSEEERARRLQRALRNKEDELARRRARAAVGVSARRLQNVSAASLAAAAAAWMTSFPAKVTAALGPIGDLLTGFADLEPLFLGLAIGCLFAGVWHWRSLRAQDGESHRLQPAPILLALSLLFLALKFVPSLA